MSEISNQSEGLEHLATELDDFLLWVGALDTSVRDGMNRLAT